jgi:glycosyltransferase involved in cell wall biosynthesis
MIRACQEAGARVVVTLHTVKWCGSFDDRPGLYEQILGQADAVVVHTREALASLNLRQGVHSDAPQCIPHGTPSGSKGDRVRGAQVLNIPSASHWRNGLVFGFIGPGKNIICTARAFAEAIASKLVPDNARLIICGEVSRGGEMYLQRLAHLLMLLGYEDRIVMREKFTNVGDVPHVFALADWGVLNTVAQTLSASGQAHQYAAFGVPLAVANRPIYYDAVRAGALPFEVDSDPAKPTPSAINAVAALAGESGQLHNECSAGLLRMAKATSWQFVAGKTQELYQRVLKRAPRHGASS